MTTRMTENQFADERLEQCENALEDVMAELWAMVVHEDMFRSNDLSADALEAERKKSYSAITRIVLSTIGPPLKRYVM